MEAGYSRMHGGDGGVRSAGGQWCDWVLGGREEDISG